MRELQATRCAVMSNEEAHTLARTCRQHRRHPGVERHVITASQHGCLRRVRRAAREPQQRDVVHARPRGLAHAKRFRHGQRQPTRTKTMLDRLSRPDVGRQRQRHREVRHTSLTGSQIHGTTLSARPPVGSAPDVSAPNRSLSNQTPRALVVAAMTWLLARPNNGSRAPGNRRTRTKCSEENGRLSAMSLCLGWSGGGATVGADLGECFATTARDRRFDAAVMRRRERAQPHYMRRLRGGRSPC
jgi:hypothetical protein